MRWQITIILAACLLLFGWGFAIGHQTASESHSTDLKALNEQILALTDKAAEWELLAHSREVDTIEVEKPVPQYRERVRTELVPVLDTIRIRDTIYLKMDRERLEYRDSLVYISVSGIMPSIDRVEHYVPRVEMIVAKRPSRWGIGLQAGVGVSPQGVAPYVGIGLNYNFKTL